MLIETYDTDPSAILDYYIDWGPWLGGDTLVSSTWVATGGTVTLSQEAIVGDFTQVWAGGGLAGELIDLTNHVVTTDGREDERTIRLIMRD
jgi:hypothetical protein